MAEEKSDIVLEREYVIPLRRKWLKVPKYKRANKAIKSIKEFLARHMRVEERDLRKVKINKFLNHEIWFRGIKKPPARIKVKAKKLKNGDVYAELAEIPEKVKWEIERDKRKEADAGAKKSADAEKKAEEKPEEEKEEAKEKDKVEKEKSTVEAGLKKAKIAAHEIKHEVGGKKKDVIAHRMALKK